MKQPNNTLLRHNEGVAYHVSLWNEARHAPIWYFPVVSWRHTYSHGVQINAAASLNREEVAKIAERFAQHARLVGVELQSKEVVDQPAGSEGNGAKVGRSLLVRPPQLPVEDPMALGERDEDDISKLEAFLIKVTCH